MNYSSDDDDKPLVLKRSSRGDKVEHSTQQKAAKIVKQAKPPTTLAAKSINDLDDSEDDKPLTCRISTASKENLDHAKKAPSLSASLPAKSRVIYEDSDDEKPISSKFVSSSDAGASTSKHYDYDDDKPLLSKVRQNGSASKDNKTRKSNIDLTKRPLDEERCSSLSSIKKPKLLDSSTPINCKLVSKKAEAMPDDDDENDHVPISERMKNQALSGCNNVCSDVRYQLHEQA